MPFLKLFCGALTALLLAQPGHSSCLPSPAYLKQVEILDCRLHYRKNHKKETPDANNKDRQEGKCSHADSAITDIVITARTTLAREAQWIEVDDIAKGNPDAVTGEVWQGREETLDYYARPRAGERISCDSFPAMSSMLLFVERPCCDTIPATGAACVLGIDFVSWFRRLDD